MPEKGSFSRSSTRRRVSSSRTYAPIDPRLGALADNGGPIKIYKLLQNSTAIDSGDDSGAPATDQRGVTRPKGGNTDGVSSTDIGAFELKANERKGSGHGHHDDNWWRPLLSPWSLLG